MIMKYSEYGLVAYIKLLFKHSLKRMKKTTINLNKYSRNQVPLKYKSTALPSRCNVHVTANEWVTDSVRERDASSPGLKLGTETNITIPGDPGLKFVRYHLSSLRFLEVSV